MKIEFSSIKLQKRFSSEKELRRTFGDIQAKKIMVRLKVLESADNLRKVPTQPPDRCHPLKGDRKGHFAVDLKHPQRLVFKPKEPASCLADYSIDLTQVTSIIIVGVEDYHG